MDINHKNATPLHLAAWINLKDIGELLISKGAIINAADIFHQNIEIICSLFKIF